MKELSIKELSIEEKAKRFDRAIEIARKISNGECVPALPNWTVYEVMLPELKENEDEKIRKYLIDVVNDYCIGNEHDECIAWLEKQGEQKSIKEYNIIGIGSKNAQGKLGEMIKNLKPVNEVVEQNPADKVKPKFKVGDWVINTITNEVEQVIELTDCEYICSGHLIVSFGNQHILKKWTIQDTFIEKACKWLTNAFHQNSNGTFNYVGGNECTIKDIVCIFKQGMEE